MNETTVDVERNGVESARTGEPVRTLLSVLIPVYNEEEYVVYLLNHVLEGALPPGVDREIIVVDDASRDDSAALVEEMSRRHPEIRLFRQPRNRGKGAAIRRALEEARGEFCIIQDADLEYDPNEYPVLLEPLLEGKADVVYGSRYLSRPQRRVHRFWHTTANRIITAVCNAVTNLDFTDVETCYKVFRTALVRSVPLRSNRFSIDPEITVKLAQRRARFYEVPVTYRPRSHDEGKKIGLKDAFSAFAAMVWYSLVTDIYKDTGPAVLEAFARAPRFNRWMADTIGPCLGPSVLEIGAGIGNLTRHLLPRRERYVATDLDPEHVVHLRNRFARRPNFEVRLGDLAHPDHLAGLEGAMDTVVCLNVIEHIEEDVAGLANLHRTLKPGGRAVVLVPQNQRAYGKLDAALGHVRRYSEAQLRETVERAGFEVERIIPFNRISYPGWVVHGRLLGTAKLPGIALAIFDRTVWFWRAVDRFLPWQALSLIAVARKRG